MKIPNEVCKNLVPWAVINGPIPGWPAQSNIWPRLFFVQKCGPPFKFDCWKKYFKINNWKHLFFLKIEKEEKEKGTRNEAGIQECRCLVQQISKGE